MCASSWSASSDWLTPAAVDSDASDTPPISLAMSVVPDGVRVTFVDAPHTRAELLEAREQVFDLTDEIQVVDVRLPADGSALKVEVAGPAEDAVVVLRARVPGLADVVVPD